MNQRIILFTSLAMLLLAVPAHAKMVQTQSSYQQTNLATLHGGGQGASNDKLLVNPWGLAFAPQTFIWIANNNSGTSTLYDANGHLQSLVVTIPTPPGVKGPAAPTGVVVNLAALSGSGEFGAAIFLFATENGTVATWNLNNNPLNEATLALDNSASGAVYKGLAIGTNAGGDKLYLTNFSKGTVEVYDTNFTPVSVVGGFSDPAIPANFSPFGITNINGDLFVTYAEPDAARTDEINGAGHGFVDKFDTDGNLLQHFASGAPLNSPWGVALAPGDFGPLSNLLLVGNFGDGKINGFDPSTGAFVSAMTNRMGRAVTNPGLWSLVFGDGSVGADNELFFTAGGARQKSGVFGDFQVMSPHTKTSAMESGTSMSGMGMSGAGISMKSSSTSGINGLY